MGCQEFIYHPQSRLKIDPPSHRKAVGMERWLSGRKRRFAKSVNGSNRSAGSNPVRSAESRKASRLISSLIADSAAAETVRPPDSLDKFSGCRRHGFPVHRPRCGFVPIWNESVAQSVEHSTFNRMVLGSSPSTLTLPGGGSRSTTRVEQTFSERCPEQELGFES